MKKTRLREDAAEADSQNGTERTLFSNEQEKDEDRVEVEELERHRKTPIANER